MIRIDSVEFSDFHLFLGMLKTYSCNSFLPLLLLPLLLLLLLILSYFPLFLPLLGAVNSISNISLISYSTIPMKIGTSKSKSARYLLEMFVELFITSTSSSQPSSTSYSSHWSTSPSNPSTILTTPLKVMESVESSNIVDKAIDFLNRYILNPLFSGEISLLCILTGLYCLRGIYLCSSLILDDCHSQSNNILTLTERYNEKKRKKYQKNIITMLLQDKPNDTSINSLCPTCSEICTTPMLFAETISTLKLYDLKYTK